MDSFGYRLYAARRSPFFPVYGRRGAALWRRRRQSPPCGRRGGEAAAAAPHGSMKPSHSSGLCIQHGSGSPRPGKRLFMTDPAFMRICVEQTAICLISFFGKWGALYVSRETFFSMGMTGKAVPAQTEADAGRYPRQDGILHMHEGRGRTACLAARLRGICPTEFRRLCCRNVRPRVSYTVRQKKQAPLSESLLPPYSIISAAAPDKTPAVPVSPPARRVFWRCPGPCLPGRRPCRPEQHLPPE